MILRVHSLAGRYCSEYSKWFKQLKPSQIWWPVVFVAAYWLGFYFLNIFRSDHVIIGLFLLSTAFAGSFGRKVFELLFPVALTYVIYSTQVLYSTSLRGRIRVEEPYQFDLYFFGIETASGRLLPSEWFQLHTHPILDFIAGISYITYVLNFALIGFAFYFWYGRKKVEGKIFRVQTIRMVWAFFWTNMLGYSTYFWYPAAPPWYVDQYGFGPANPNALPSPAGAARFDQLFDIQLFTNFYSKSANVFGAIPSLHIVYPLVAVYFAFRLGKLRSVAMINFLVVCFSAVYLNHHYVLDVLWGMAYALGVCWIVENVGRWREKKKLDAPLRISVSEKVA